MKKKNKTFEIVSALLIVIPVLILVVAFITMTFFVHWVLGALIILALSIMTGLAMRDEL